MNVGWPMAATDAILSAGWPLPRRKIDGGFHADQQDSTLGWIVCFRAGSRNGPCLLRRCPADEPAATRLCRSGQVPKYTAVQCGLLDPMRPTRIHCDGRRSRPVHPVADSPRCKWVLRWRRQLNPALGEAVKESSVMKAIWRGQVIAESDRTLEVGGYRYFPRETVRMDLLHLAPKTQSDLECPHGVQFYERAAWSYEAPRASMKQVDRWIGFWNDVEIR